MLCKELQTKIAVHDPLSEAERRHVGSCADCASFAAFNNELGFQVTEWRVPLSAPRRQARTVRSFRWSFVGAGLVVALAFAAIVLPGRADARSTYRRMLTRIQEVSTVHLIVRWRPGNGNVEDGPMRQTEELWWRPGAWRETWERGRPKLKLAGEDGMTFYRYDPATRRVEASHEVSPQRDYRRFDLAVFAKDYMPVPTRFEQSSPTTLIATNAEGWSRMTFTLDPKTGLPTHAVKEHRGRGGAWETAGELDLQFDQPLSGGLFDPENLCEKPRP